MTRRMAVEPQPLTAVVPARRGTIRNILLNAGWMLGGKGVGGILSTVYLAIATRSLGVEGFGKFALVLGLGQGVAGLASFQSWQIVVRYGMDHLHAGRDDALSRLIRFSAFLDIASGLVAGLLVTIGMLLIGPHLGWSWSFTWQALAACLMLVLSIHSTPIGVLRLHDRFGNAAAAETMTPVTRFLGAIVIWLVHPSVVGFLAVWSLAEVVTAAAYWILAARIGGVEWKLWRRVRWRQTIAENSGLVRYAWTTNLSSSLGVGGKQVMVLLVGLLVTPAAAGGFRVAQQLSQALGKISQLLSLSIFPELVRSKAGDQEGHFDRLFARTQRLAMIGGATVIAVLLLVGRPALSLIAGHAFLGVYPMLLVLGVAAAIDFAAVGFEPALIAQGRPGLALKLRGVATLVMFALMLVLTPSMGAMGAALAVLASSLILFATSWWALKRL